MLICDYCKYCTIDISTLESHYHVCHLAAST